MIQLRGSLWLSGAFDPTVGGATVGSVAADSGGSGLSFWLFGAFGRTFGGSAVGFVAAGGGWDSALGLGY